MLLRRVDLHRALPLIRDCRGQRCFAYAAWLSQRLLGSPPPPGLPSIRFNFVERRFLEGVVARRAPETMGMLMPVFSSHPLQALRYLRHELYPKPDQFGSRTQRLSQLFRTLVSFFRERGRAG